MNELLEPLALSMGMSGTEMMNFYIAQVVSEAHQSRWWIVGFNLFLAVGIFFGVRHEMSRDEADKKWDDTPLFVPPAILLSVFALPLLMIVFNVTNKELAEPDKYAYELAIDDAKKLSIKTESIDAFEKIK